MNLLNFARMCWQLKDYNFKVSSVVHIINILKGHILPYSNIWRRRSLKSELFLSIQKKSHQHYHSRNQKVPFITLWEYFYTCFCEVLCSYGFCVTMWSPSSWFLQDLYTPGLPKNRTAITPFMLPSYNMCIAISKSTRFFISLFLMPTYPWSTMNKERHSAFSGNLVSFTLCKVRDLKYGSNETYCLPENLILCE